MLGTHTWYKAWLGSCGFDKSNLVPTSVSVGLVRLSSDRHDLIPPPLATRLTKDINVENDNEKYYLTTKTKTKNPLMKRHCKLEGIYFSLPAFALSGN